MDKPTIVMITGFLGSGKTTLLLRLLAWAQACGLKCAIIENEVGEMAIDQRQAEKSGIDVYTLFGGCVCCTLRATLMATVNRLLEEEQGIDLILFETSGVAEGDGVMRAIEASDYGSAGGVLPVVVFDPLRVDAYRTRISRMLNGQLSCAACVVIGKADKASEAQMAQARELIASRGVTVPVYETGAVGDPPRGLLDQIMLAAKR